MFIIISAIIGAIILFDFAIIGFLPKLLKIWQPLNGMLSNVLIEDTVYFSIRTNIPDRSGTPIITSRITYKSVLLTPKHLVVKNTRLTYLLSIDINDIHNYTAINKAAGKEMKFFVGVNDGNYWFRFRTNKSKMWEDELERLGVTKT